jgi:hypothetical protein
MREHGNILLTAAFVTADYDPFYGSRLVIVIAARRINSSCMNIHSQAQSKIVFIAATFDDE